MKKTSQVRDFDDTQTAFSVVKKAFFTEKTSQKHKDEKIAEEFEADLAGMTAPQIRHKLDSVEDQICDLEDWYEALNAMLRLLANDYQAQDDDIE